MRYNVYPALGLHNLNAEISLASMVHTPKRPRYVPSLLIPLFSATQQISIRLENK
jgi:hypothetical protein